MSFINLLLLQDDMGLDAEAMQRYIATMPHAMEMNYQPASPANSRSPRSDTQKSDTVDGDRVEESSLDLSMHSSPQDKSAASSKKDNSNGSAFVNDSKAACVINFGCDEDKLRTVDIINAAIKRDESVTKAAVNLESEKEVLVLNFKKGEISPVVKVEGDNNEKESNLVKDQTKPVGSGEPGRKSVKSLNDVISNLSQDLCHSSTTLNDLVAQPPSSSLPSSISSILFDNTSSSAMSQKQEDKNSSDLTKNSDMNGSASHSAKGQNGKSLTCKSPHLQTSGSANNSRRRMRKPVAANVSGASAAPVPPESQLQLVTPPLPPRHPAAHSTPLSSPHSAPSTPNSSNPAATATSNPALFPAIPLGYEKFGMLPAVYDYNLPDRGLSSAAAAVMAANPRFPPPHMSGSQPFMMSYFPLQPVWGGSPASAVAIAAQAAQTSPGAGVNVPSPLDLSSPGREKTKDSNAADKVSEQLTNESQPKDLSAKLSNTSTNQQRLVTKEITKRVSRGGQVKSSKKSTVEKLLCAKISEKQLDCGSQSCGKEKQNPIDDSTLIPEEGTKAKYEKNLLLFNDTEIEIMSVGKLRWVVRNETDLLRIASAKLKSGPVCDSASVLQEVTSVHSSSGEVVHAGAKSDRSDCPVSSSVRREEIELEDGLQASTNSPVKCSPSQQQRLIAMETTPTVITLTSLEDQDLHESSSPPAKKARLSPSMLTAHTPSSPVGKISDSIVSAPSASSLPNFLIDSSTVDKSSSLNVTMVTANDPGAKLSPTTEGQTLSGQDNGPQVSGDEGMDNKVNSENHFDISKVNDEPMSKDNSLLTNMLKS